MLDSESWRAGMAEVLPHAQAFLSLVTDFKTDYAAAKTEQRALDFPTWNVSRFGFWEPGPAPAGNQRPSPARFTISSSTFWWMNIRTSMTFRMRSSRS